MAKKIEYEYIQYKRGSINNNINALSRNAPPVVMPLLKELSIDPDPSSEESLFSFPNKQQPLVQESIEASGIVATTPPRLLMPENSTLPEIQEPIIEEFDESNNEPYLSLDSRREEDNNDLFLSDSILIGRSNETNIRLNIIDSRESLLKQKNNLVIFIYKSGAPFDNDAKELHKAELLPQFHNVMYERA